MNIRHAALAVGLGATLTLAGCDNSIEGQAVNPGTAMTTTGPETTGYSPIPTTETPDGLPSTKATPSESGPCGELTDLRVISPLSEDGFRLANDGNAACVYDQENPSVRIGRLATGDDIFVGCVAGPTVEVTYKNHPSIIKITPHAGHLITQAVGAVPCT